MVIRLSRGEPRDVIQRDLERSRPDKPRPAFYAQLTLDKAVRELQLSGSGAPDSGERALTGGFPIFHKGDLYVS